MATGTRSASRGKPRPEDPLAGPCDCNREAASLVESEGIAPGGALLLAPGNHSMPSGAGKTYLVENYLKTRRVGSDMKEREPTLMRVPTTAGGIPTAVVLDETGQLRTPIDVDHPRRR